MEGSTFLNITLSFWTKPRQNGSLESNVSRPDWSLVADNHINNGQDHHQQTHQQSNENLPYYSTARNTVDTTSTTAKKTKKNSVILLFETNNNNNNYTNQVADVGLINQNANNLLFDHSNANKTPETSGTSFEWLLPHNRTLNATTTITRQQYSTFISTSSRLPHNNNNNNNNNHQRDDSLFLFDNLPSIQTINSTSTNNNNNNSSTTVFNHVGHGHHANTTATTNTDPIASYEWDNNWTWPNFTDPNESNDWRGMFYLNNSNNNGADADIMWNAANDCFGTIGQMQHDACLMMKANGTSNANGTTDLETLEHERVYWALILIILPILALFGNILVILSVYRERSLQTVTNWFIVSLAFADLFVTIPMLFSTYVMVNVDWGLSEVICDLYIATDVICSTASIFNLVAISFDRYIAVTHPIFYSKHKNDKRVVITIILVWMASFGVGLPIMLGANTSPERIPELCIFYNSDFIIYSSLWSFYVPCLMMVILYYKIFKAIHDRARKKIDHLTSSSNSKNNKSTIYSSSKPSVNNQSNKTKNMLRIDSKTLDNISLSKQLQIKSGKLEQIKVPMEDKNHIRTSIAIISTEINIINNNNDNDNSNNTESHLDDDEDDDDDDIEEEEQEAIEIKQLEKQQRKQATKRSTKLATSDHRCSINSNDSTNLNETNLRDDPKPLGADQIKNNPNNLNNNKKCDMFIVANATAALNSADQSHLVCPTIEPIVKTNNVKDNINDNSSPSGSTSGLSKEKDQPDSSNDTVTANATKNAIISTCLEKDDDEIDDTANIDTNIKLNTNDDSICPYSKKKSRFNLGRKHKSSRKKREKVSARRERKATKTLAIVLGKRTTKCNECNHGENHSPTRILFMLTYRNNFEFLFDSYSK